MSQGKRTDLKRGEHALKKGDRRAHTPRSKMMNTLRRREAREGARRREEMLAKEQDVPKKQLLRMIREARYQRYGEPSPEEYEAAEAAAKKKPKTRPTSCRKSQRG